MRQIRRFVRWAERHQFSGVELLYFLLFSWFVLSLVITPRLQLVRSPLVHRMTEMLPLEVWIAAMVVIWCCMAVGLAVQSPPILALGLLAAVCFWFVIAALVWDASHSMLGVGIYVILASPALWRYAGLPTPDGR